MESEVYWLLVKCSLCGYDIHRETVFTTLLVIERKIFCVTYDTNIKIFDVIRVRTQVKVEKIFCLGRKVYSKYSTSI